MEHTRKLLLVDPARLAAVAEASVAQQGFASSVKDNVDIIKSVYRPSVVDKQLSRLDTDISETLNSNLPDDVKAKKYEMILRSFRYYEPKVAVESPAQIQKKKEEDRLLESTPLELRPKARRLLKSIKQHARLTDDDQLITDENELVKESDLGELLASAVTIKRKTKKRPPGYEEFAELLQRAKAPQELIADDVLRRYVFPKLKSKSSSKKPIKGVDLDLSSMFEEEDSN